MKRNLHLCTAVLEPEFDLARIQVKPMAKMEPLLLIRMRTLLENPKIGERGCNLSIKIKEIINFMNKLIKTSCDCEGFWELYE